MLKKTAVKKIFRTSLVMFILLVSFSLSSINDNKVLRTNFEIKNSSNINSADIFLLNKNNYLVQKKIVLVNDNKKDNLNELVNSLIDGKNNKYSDSLIFPIPKNTKINNIILGDKLITIDFSKELLNVSVEHEKHMISSIVYTILNYSKVDGVSILVDGKILDSYPNTKENLPPIINKNIGINNVYDLTSRNNVSKVVIYYVNNIDNENFYVPVTKYLNDSRDKIKIIVDELSTRYIYEDNLMSFLHNKTKLLDYYLDSNILFLNFNNYLFDCNNKILEEVMYTIGYSVFDNYDVDMVMFRVNGNDVQHLSRLDIK